MGRVLAGEKVRHIAAELGRNGEALYGALHRRFPDWKPSELWASSYRVPTEPTDLAYLAGLFDGEGSISVVGPSHTQLRIGMTDKEVIDWVAQFGGSVYRDRRSTKAGGLQPRRDCWTWTLFRRYDVIALLEAMVPYMKLESKRAKAIEAIARFPHPVLGAPRPGRQGIWQASKTHCKRGHEFTPENTYRRPSQPNYRYCRACMVWRRKNPKKLISL
jgi:hypothetical protein